MHVINVTANSIQWFTVFFLFMGYSGRTQKNKTSHSVLIVSLFDLVFLLDLLTTKSIFPDISVLTEIFQPFLCVGMVTGLIAG